MERIDEASSTPGTCESACAASRRKRRWLIWLLIVLAVMILPPCVASFGVRYWIKGEIAALEKLLRQAGLPLTQAELNAWYASAPQPPPDRNAAPLYEKAFALLPVRRSIPVIDSPALGGENGPLATGLLTFAQRRAASAPPDGQQKPDWAALVREHQEALDALHRATALPECRFSAVDSADLGFFPRAVGAENAARLLRAELVLHLANASDAGVVDALLALAALPRTMAAEPSPFSVYVQSEDIRQAVEALQEAFTGRAFTPEQLARVTEAFRSMELAHSAEAVTAGGLAFLDYYRTLSLASFAPAYSLGAAGGAFVAEVPVGRLLTYGVCRYSGLLDFQYMCELDRVAVDASNLIPPLSASMVAAKRTSVMSVLPRWALWCDDRIDHLRTTSPSLIAFHLSQSHTKLRLAFAALDLERLRIESGALPDTFDSTATDAAVASKDAIATSPLPIEYLRFPTGYMLIELGANGALESANARIVERIRNNGPQDTSRWIPDDAFFLVAR